MVQTQVIPYLRELVKGGHEMTLLTFEPGDVDEGIIRESLAADGIEWHWLRYHKRPSVPATLFDVVNGIRLIITLGRKRHFDILHGRVHVPMLMAAVAHKFLKRRPKLLFDIRGFLPDEYADAGVWPMGGWLYRSAKRVEQWLIKESDGFVVLTDKARNLLFPGAADTGVDVQGRPVEMIPCCFDYARLGSKKNGARKEIRQQLGIEDRKVITYVGSFGGWYLSDEMLDFLRKARESDPRVFAMILTQRDKASVTERLLAANFKEKDFLVESVAPNEIPDYLSAADVALSFIKPCYSKQAASPTKVAEYLACGLPIIANSGVGDMEELIGTDRVGIILEGLNDRGYSLALDGIDQLMREGELADRCKESSIRRFDLRAVGGERYRSLYSRLLKGK